MRGLTIRVAIKAAVAARFVDVAQASHAEGVEALGRRADVGQRRTVLVGQIDEVVARTAHRTNAVRFTARAQKNRHQARDAGFGRRFVDDVSIGQAEVGSGFGDVVDHDREGIVVDGEAALGYSWCRAGRGRWEW